MISSLLKAISEKDWSYNDSPHHWTQVYDPSFLATWSEVEYCLNNPQFYNIQFVNRDTNVYIDLPKYERCWSMPSQDVREVVDTFNQGHTCIINNFEWVNRDKQEICRSIEELFPDIRASLHIYCGIEPGKSFKIHEDYANNLICQVEGETHWTIYNNRASNIVGQKDFTEGIDQSKMDVAIDVILKPGDILYIPARCYHQARPTEKRLSVSIPMQHMLPHLKKVDRNYYAITS